MKTLIVASALALVLVSAPLMAQDGGGGTPGAGLNRNPDPAIGPGTDTGPSTGSVADPAQRVRPEIDRRRSYDLQRGASPMTTDPRFGPPSSTDSGGPGRVPGAGGFQR